MNRSFKQLSFLFLSTLFYIVAQAQEKGIDVSITTKKKEEWYQHPWVWVVGAAVFIFLLVAMVKGKDKK